MEIRFLNALFFLLIFSITPFFSAFTFQEKRVFTISGQAQGTTYSIKYLAESIVLEKAEIDLLLAQLDSSLSRYKDYSLICQFNQVEREMSIDKHLYNVVACAQKISQETKGTFDITTLNLSSLWGFTNKQANEIPTPQQIGKVLSITGFQHLQLRDSFLLKDHPAVKIDCDGIAQGYSVDKIAALLEQKGIVNYSVELGGEVRTKGLSGDGKPWMVSVDMVDKQQHPKAVFLKLNNEAVTTSGNLSKYSKIKNQFFSHVIDPHSGRPVDNGMVAVTVVYKDATTADGLDNAFMVMGYKKALEFANAKENMGIYMIFRKKDGSLSDTANAYFKDKIIPFAEASPHWQ